MERREDWLGYVGLGLSGLALLVALRERLGPRRVSMPVARAHFHGHPGPFRRPHRFGPLGMWGMRRPPMMRRMAHPPFGHRPHFHPWKGRRHGKPRWM